MIEVTGHEAEGAPAHLRIEAVDPVGDGGAHHRYKLTSLANGAVSVVRFQKGPVLEAGVNGLTNEVLLAIVAHRLECFQAGEFACTQNAMALEAVNVALDELHERTIDRLNRGVEGKTEA